MIHDKILGGADEDKILERMKLLSSNVDPSTLDRYYAFHKLKKQLTSAGGGSQRMLGDDESRLVSSVGEFRPELVKSASQNLFSSPWRKNEKEGVGKILSSY